MGLILAGCSGTSHSQTEHEIDPAIAMNHELTVFRSPTCGCCHLWAEHMKEAGFQVRDEITEDMQAIKQQYGIPANLASCHTTIVDGFVVEGHIPATDVARLLTEQPDISGIAVPGMPIGSPGMESGNYIEPYTVFSFTEDGTLKPYAEHS
ncbi:MAG: DUF411 domain-containing protein [Cyanobacteria bacterium P01_A01_bin.37]